LFKLDEYLIVEFEREISSDSRLLSLQEFKNPPDLSELELMSTERCAKLMAVSMANNLDEVWISSEPALLMVYFKQYLPNLFRWYVLINVTSCFCDDRAVFN